MVKMYKTPCYNKTKDLSMAYVPGGVWGASKFEDDV